MNIQFNNSSYLIFHTSKFKITYGTIFYYKNHYIKNQHTSIQISKRKRKLKDLNRVHSVFKFKG
jgi:hypothetical protein